VIGASAEGACQDSLGRSPRKLDFPAVTRWRCVSNGIWSPDCHALSAL